MTTEELEKLSPKQKRVKIAEACGWVYMDKNVGRPPAAGIGSMEQLPDYISSLDAMHEAEKTLTYEQCRAYNMHISTAQPFEENEENPNPAALNFLFHAPAAQRVYSTSKYDDARPFNRQTADGPRLHRGLHEG